MDAASALFAPIPLVPEADISTFYFTFIQPCANGSPGNITKVPCAGVGPAITKYKASVSVDGKAASVFDVQLTNVALWLPEGIGLLSHHRGGL